MGVVSAGMRFAGFEYTCPFNDNMLNGLAVVIYAALCVYFITACIKSKKDA